MSDLLPPEISVRRVADGVAYDLPSRPLGGLGVLAAFLIGFGVVFAAAPVTFAVLRLAAGSPGVFEIVLALLSLPFALVGGIVCLIGLAMVRGQSSVVVRPDRLVAIEHLGPLRWRRRRKADTLRRIEVRRGESRVNGRVVTEGALAEWSMMTAEFDGGRPLILAVGYPESWLTAIAERLRADLAMLWPATLFGDGEPVTVDIVHETSLDKEAPEKPVSRPADTAVTVDENPDGVTVTIPPSGVRKGSKGLFGFSVLWCGFMLVFTVAVVAGPVMRGSFSVNPWGFAAFCAAFWAIGIGMMVGAVNMGRRHAIIDVVDDVLLINRRNMFGIKTHQWTRDELDTVTVGPSGMEVNEIPVLELKVRPVKGRPLGLFAGRDDQELLWIASRLRERLWDRAGDSSAVA